MRTLRESPISLLAPTLHNESGDPFPHPCHRIAFALDGDRQGVPPILEVLPLSRVKRPIIDLIVEFAQFLFGCRKGGRLPCQLWVGLNLRFQLLYLSAGGGSRLRIAILRGEVELWERWGNARSPRRVPVVAALCLLLLFWSNRRRREGTPRHEQAGGPVGG